MNENLRIFIYFFLYLLSMPTVEENHLLEKLNSNKGAKNKYPVLNKNKENFEYLQTCSQINNFTNYKI